MVVEFDGDGFVVVGGRARWRLYAYMVTGLTAVVMRWLDGC